MKNLILAFLFIISFVSLKAQELTVYIFIAEECPISIYMAKPLKETVKAYGEEVNFMAVFPKKNSTLKTANQFLNDYGLSDFGVMIDNDQHFSKSVNATITPEAVVTDEAGKILYRGRISDAYRAPGKMKHGPRKNELTDILASLLEGQTVANWQPAVGCFITFHNS